MKLLVVMAAAQALFAMSAHAQWMRVGSDGEVDAYFDSATRIADGAIVKVQVLLDYKEPRQWTDYLVYSSMVSAREYDCPGARLRVAMSEFHFAPMAQDEPRFSTPGGVSWKAVSDDGVESALFKRVCAGS